MGFSCQIEREEMHILELKSAIRILQLAADNVQIMNVKLHLDSKLLVEWILRVADMNWRIANLLSQ